MQKFRFNLEKQPFDSPFSFPRGGIEIDNKQLEDRTILEIEDVLMDKIMECVPGYVLMDIAKQKLVRRLANGIAAQLAPAAARHIGLELAEITIN